ncbi:MAG: class I SAM-dependent methyltransferase [Pseudomonadota bacterium]|nr:class I SAM-dependent methyltransferase [Pseudomonadota bacterium]
MKLGRVASARPLSDMWGMDRGRPIDRYYIESFLTKHATDVAGRVLEIQEDGYSRRFGGDRVTHQDVLSLDASNPKATIIGDLADPATLPAGQFDCIILTQTLHLVFDMAVAVANVQRALRPGGVLLVTVPGITPLDRHEFLDSWYWSLTEPALRRLLCGPFRPEKVDIKTHGNLFAATAFLHGAAVEEVSKRKLDRRDRAFPVTIAARAIA